jgi:MFS family permease
MLRSNRSLRRLLGSWAQSCVGTGVGYVALLVLTIRYLHTSWAISAVLLADFVPWIALGAWFGVCADRYSKRTLIVVSNVLQAGAWGGLTVAHTLVPILGLALLAGVGNAMLRPALRSALPIIAGEATQTAVAWYDTCRWVGLTAGPLAAAVLFAVSGVGVPLALNGLSFLVAAVVMAGVRVDSPPHAEEHGHIGSGLRAGLAVAFSAPGIAAVIGCAAAQFISGGLLNVCEPLLATKVLRGSSSDYALLVACYGIGMVTATLFVARRGRASAATLVRRYLDALTLIAVGMFASAIVGSVLPATVAFAVTGYANALLLVSATQLIQLRVPIAVQGRLFGAKDMLEGAGFLLGLLGAGALVAAAGVRVTLAAGAGICGVCALTAIATVRLGRAAPVPPQGAGLEPLG